MKRILQESMENLVVILFFFYGAAFKNYRENSLSSDFRGRGGGFLNRSRGNPFKQSLLSERHENVRAFFSSGKRVQNKKKIYLRTPLRNQ